MRRPGLIHHLVDGCLVGFAAPRRPRHLIGTLFGCLGVLLDSIEHFLPAGSASRRTP
jgi:hypothetical protein